MLGIKMSGMISLQNNTNGQFASELFLQNNEYHIRINPGEALQSTQQGRLIHSYPDGTQQPVRIGEFFGPVDILVVKDGHVISKQTHDIYNNSVQVTHDNESVSNMLSCGGGVCRVPFGADRFAYHYGPRPLGLHHPDPYPFGQQTPYINYNPELYYESYQRDPVYALGYGGYKNLEGNTTQMRGKLFDRL